MPVESWGNTMTRLRLPKACVYCGIRPGTTRDHVVPKCLFPGNLPKVMVTVPSCRSCNEGKAVDDTYLRDWLAIDIENSRHPAANELLRGSVGRAAQRNQSDLVRDIRSKSTIEAWTTMGGIYLGH